MISAINNHRLYSPLIRPNIFQVMSEDGRSKVNLHCDNDTPGQLMEWTTAVNDTIDEFTKAEVGTDDFCRTQCLSCDYHNSATTQMERSNATLDRNDQVNFHSQTDIITL